jgi:hypothetical protein
MRETPRPYQVYRHFKGAYYQVICVASHSETEEKLVIYRPLFEETDHVCARPLEMFLSEVDHEKYPDVKQKWRFALATGPFKGSGAKHKSEPPVSEEPASRKDEENAENAENADSAENAGSEENAGSAENAPAFLDRFLDADTYEKKLDVFTGMWKTIEEQDIDNAALVMDIQLNGETVEDKYKEMLNCLKMRARYESTRLR